MKTGSTNASLAKITTFMGKIQDVIGGLAMFVLLVVVAFDVLFRELGTPLVWLQNVASVAFVWVVFFGAAIGIKNGTHYTIKLVTNPRPVWRKLTSFAIIACQLIFVFVLIVYGYEFTEMSVKRLIMPAGIPMAYATAAIPLTAVFMLAYTVEAVINGFNPTGEGGRE